ncbi:hypothetical protein FGRMN_10849 [Fusarium graminum]|nr:hypothetical protein FGRMN_10849 [Fusarium graminum]
MQPNDNRQLLTPNPTAHAQPQSSKRHSSDSQDPYVGNLKRQRTILDKSLTHDTHRDVTQSPGSSFTLTEILHDSTNTDTVESPQSSLDPPPQLQDPYDDPYDDPDLDQLFESLTRPIYSDRPGTSPHLGDATNECVLKSDKDALTELLDEVSCGEPQQPPSSVLRTWSRNSRSTGEYDPWLQHSSPQSNLDIPGDSVGYAPLPEGVDWSTVEEHVRHMPEPGSTVEHSVTDRSKVPEYGLQPATQRTGISSQSRSSAPTKSQSPAMIVGQALLKPFKTFFDLGELLDAKAKMFRNQPEVTFELFARVVYSSRENFHKKQYFRFRSLLKDCPPYINGALLG